MTEFTDCKEIGCDLPAEVTRRDVMESTNGPIVVIGTICVNKHVLLMPEESVYDL